MLRRLTCLLALLCLFHASRAWATTAYRDELIRRASEKRLSETRDWHLLLHNRRNLFGVYRSEVDDPGFFLSPRGRHDPAAELEATLASFFEPPVPLGDIQHPQCRYPARYAWLKEQLHFQTQVSSESAPSTSHQEGLLEHPCPRFEQWRSRMNADSVTLIFASYYMNNPASMYGHTFLRLNSRSYEGKEHLLDYVVNFAADVTTRNGIAFALWGLSGEYRGRFSTMPYYIKVQEYNNMESRDLWEYTLTLSPSEVERLLQHLWELGQTSMAYFFLNRNCSYQLLPVLEVARPSLHLKDAFWAKAIPVDTLRIVLKQPGLVAGVRRRPSHVTAMLAERSELQEPEIRLAEQLAKGVTPETSQGLSALRVSRQRLVLDSAYNLFRYRTGFKRDQPAPTQAQERKLLLLRHQTGMNEEGPPQVPAPRDDLQLAVPPDRGHRTGRVGVSYGFTHRSHFEELSLRSALHDQDDPTDGYLSGSQLQMFHLRLRYDNDHDVVYLKQLTLVDLISFSPWDRWVHPPSWRVGTGLEVAHDLDRNPEDSLYYALHGGSGVSVPLPFSRHAMAYALATADSGVGTVFRDNYRIGGGGMVGFFFDLAEVWRLHVDASHIHYPLGEPGGATRLRLIQAFPLTKTAQLRAQLERQNNYKEVLLSILVHL